ncbi:MAG TPA: hypothetical protein VN228_00580 [Pyrinomonadaceae bacterium]|nr:hypothetical protein [Pyrinomonadaceae bacterium]
MPGLLLHQGAQVMCSHGGTAQPLVVNPQVTVGGQPIVTLASPYSVAGCAMPPPTAGNGPCVTAQFTTAATRVTAGGQPVLLNTSQATCVPTGTPLVVAATQTRVTAT